jgi:PKHD-type hydroxylase
MTKNSKIPVKYDGPQNNSWPFSIDKTHGWAFANEVFTPQECAKIIALGKKQFMHEALVGEENVANKKVRKSKTSWIFPNDEHNWIFYRMTNLVEQLNREYFNFNLFGFTEGFQFTEYEAPGGYYSKHIDKMFGKTIRKLSITVQLSDPTDYQGGDLELFFGGKPDVMDKAQGKAIAFPSYVVHEVKPVTKGTRYSLVAWVTGEPFK